MDDKTLYDNEVDFHLNQNDHQLKDRGGVFSFLRPTHASFTHKHDEKTELRWNSRSHRKGRHLITIHKPANTTLPTTQARRGGFRFKLPVFKRHTHQHHHITPFQPSNISWWVATAFVIGSAVWIVNGFFVWLPTAFPDAVRTNNPASVWTGFAGGTIFEVGAWLAWVESLNRGRTVCFGGEVEGLLRRVRSGRIGGQSRLVEEGNGKEGSVLQGEACKHVHHTHLFHRRSSTSTDTTLPTSSNTTRSPSSSAAMKPTQQWRWYGWLPHELGYLASIIQFLAATIFWISTITGLPNILYAPTPSNLTLRIIFFWTPQVVGGLLFIISSLLYMLETQKAWYKLNLTSLGWWIAVWNLVGSVGFCLCGALGYAADRGSTRCAYQSGLSTFWASFGFMIGSCLQWWEGVDTAVVEVVEDKAE